MKGVRKLRKPSGNYFLLPNCIFEEDMDLKEFKVYAYLMRCSDTTYRCYPSRETIARKCRIGSVTTVDRAIKGLKDGGYIDVIPRYNADGNGRLSNVYVVNKIDDMRNSKTKSKKFK